jgi:hypothetical protein
VNRLCAPMPPHWTEHLDPDKGVYYFNANTGESAWEHPMDDYYRKLFKSLFNNKEEMQRLMGEQSLFQLSQVGLKTNALLKEHNQVRSRWLARNPACTPPVLLRRLSLVTGAELQCSTGLGVADARAKPERRARCAEPSTGAPCEQNISVPRQVAAAG